MISLRKMCQLILTISEAMLLSLDDISGFTNSSLYEHMEFKKTSSTFSEELKQNLLNCFRDKDTYGFLEDNERWKSIT